MTGQDQTRGVFITGDITNWAIVKMNPEGNNIFNYTTNLMPGDSLAYYYLTTSTWTNYLNYREKIPAECALFWNSDRRIIVPEVDKQIGVVWASCKEFLNTSTLQFKNTKLIRIYPNPTIGKINIKAEFSLEYSILYISNMSGQVMKQINLQSKNGFETIHVSELPAGLYLFRVQNKNTFDTFKVMLQ
jgi:hypothetical protein